MVRNEGEPGGGPYWVEHEDGTRSVQIVESAEFDPRQKHFMQQATHFNPVDLVCAVRNRRGEPYPLQHFINPEAYFISEKTVEGHAIKALEWPGLWNGAMANWNSVFIEVPPKTFNPVKTVLDLLREEHQG